MRTDLRKVLETNLMKKIVEILTGPAIPETGGVDRVVVFDSGAGQVQTYIPERRIWVKGGNLYSFRDAETATPERLKELGYDDEDIRNIFWRPGSE